MEKELLTYTLLFGFSKTAKKLETNERLLFHIFKDKNNYNSEFFKRVIEVIKCCFDTMTLEQVSEYFNLSKELIQALLNDSDTTFLNSCKGLITEKYSDQFIQTEKVIGPNKYAENQVLENLVNLLRSKKTSNPANSLNSTHSVNSLNNGSINSKNSLESLRVLGC